MDCLMKQNNFMILVLLLLTNSNTGNGSSLWSVWWNYDGISGPRMWGTMTSDWYMCSKGKNQSPIDIEPNMLLFDPTLKNIEIHGDMITGTVINNGVDLSVEINDTSGYPPVNLTLGPLSYTYRIARLKFHFGRWDGTGSEHSVKGEFFDGEIQIEAYNSDVFSNFSHAQNAPRGIAIIAAFLQVGKRFDEDFQVLLNLSKLVPYKETWMFNARWALLPTKYEEKKSKVKVVTIVLF